MKAIEQYREQRTIAGKQVWVTVVKSLNRAAPVPSALGSLLKGLRLTLGYFIRPSRIVTRQYPENRQSLSFPPRYRARLHLIHQANGFHKCTACRMCEKACPNASIKILGRKGAVTGKTELDHYIWRMDSCLLCNACVQACPCGALAMGPEFENAVYDRRLLIFNLNRYAGPPASVLEKAEYAKMREQMMEPREAYLGPVPFHGAPTPAASPNVKLVPGDDSSTKVRIPPGENR